MFVIYCVFFFFLLFDIYFLHPTAVRSCRRRSHLKNLSIVMQEPGPLAFLVGGEEGESRLNKIITTKNKINNKNHFYMTTYAFSLCFDFFCKKCIKAHLLVFPLPACTSFRWPLSAKTEYSHEDRRRETQHLLGRSKTSLLWGGDRNFRGRLCLRGNGI